MNEAVHTNALNTEQETTSLSKVPGLAAILVTVTAAFGAWSLLLPVLPLAVLEAGGSAGLAGASTGVFMAATVVVQSITPWLLRTWGYRPVMMASGFMLGVPALGHLLGMDAWVVLLFSALRGMGFGGLTVAQAALVAELVPHRLLGKATGTLGVFIGTAQMAFLPAGIALSRAFGFGTAFVTAAVIGLVAVACGLRVPRMKAQAPEVQEDTQSRTAPTWKLVAVPALALTSMAMGFGVISSFLPAAISDSDAGGGAVLGGIILSLVGGSIMLGRFGAGVLADRSGLPGRYFLPALLGTFFGLILLACALALGWNSAFIVLGALLFGGSFGVGQNEALLSMFSRLPRSKVSEASAVWNIFYDGGTGLGSAALAFAVTAYGYAGAFGAGAAVVVLGTVVTVVDLVLGRHRVAEHGNIRTRIKRLRKV